MLAYCDVTMAVETQNRTCSKEESRLGCHMVHDSLQPCRLQVSFVKL